MKVAICAIVRLENLYIRDWLEYHIKLGFNKFILFDNNKKGEDNLSDVINDYILNNTVTIIEETRTTSFQEDDYNYVIKNYSDKFDWILFIDIDEYFILVLDNNIEEYLNRFSNNIETIAFNWRLLDDNENVLYEDKPVIDRFKTFANDSVTYGYNFPENYHIKTMVHCKLNNNIKFVNPHSCINSNYSVLSDGTTKEIANSPFNKNINYEYAYIKHFMLKSLEEFCWKIKRNSTFTSAYNYSYNFIKERYSKINKWNEDKENYLKNIFKNN